MKLVAALDFVAVSFDVDLSNMIVIFCLSSDIVKLVTDLELCWGLDLFQEHNIFGNLIIFWIHNIFGRHDILGGPILFKDIIVWVA